MSTTGSRNKLTERSKGNVARHEVRDGLQGAAVGDVLPTIPRAETFSKFAGVIPFHQILHSRGEHGIILIYHEARGAGRRDSTYA